MLLSRRQVAALSLLLCNAGGQAASAQVPPAGQGTLRIGMTSGDLPTTTGAPNQGLEGLRFAGYPVFEPLVMWDLRQTEGVPGIIPWLATDWKTDPSDRNKWVFTLRQGVKFHDGSAFDADAVVFNLARFFDRSAPQFEQAAATVHASKAPFVDRWEKIDAHTVAIYTKAPTTYFTEVLSGLLMASPAQYEATGRNWQSFADKPSGTGAFRIAAIDRRVSITLEKNPAYWNTDRAAKLAKVLLLAIPESSTRVAALRSGQVDWIEVPPPDALASLAGAGFTVKTSPFPQVWPYWLRTTDPVFKDVRVRRALNYAMDRDGLVTLLSGAADPAAGFWKPGDPRFGRPQNRYTYDPAKAKALLAEAGFKDKRVPVKVLISTAGSGQMLPQPMNELLQQSAAEAGFDLSFVVVDFAKMISLRNTPNAPEMQGVVAANYSWTTADMGWFYFAFNPPNWAGYENPEVVALLNRYRSDFEVKNPAELLAQVHEKLVDDAPWVWIVHDRNPRAFSPKLSGYLPVQSWFTDLTAIGMG